MSDVGGSAALARDSAPMQEVDFKALIEGIEAITWEMDSATWRFTYVSPQAESILGYPLARWYEDSFWADILVHPADRDWAIDFCASATTRGEDHAFEYRAISRSGEVVWLRDLVRVVPRAGGAPMLRGVMVDITAAKRAEEASVQLRAELVEAQRLAHIGSWRWDIGTDEVTWSDELYRIYGVERDTFGASFGAYLERVHPEDRERVQARLREALEGGGEFDFEERIVRPDGEVRWLRSRGRAVSEGDEVVRLLGTCQDITDQRRAMRREQKLFEERLARKQAERERGRLRALFANAPAAIGVLEGPDLVFRTVNARFMELTGHTDILGKTLAEAMPELEHQGFVKLIREVYETGEPFRAAEVLAEYQHANGDLRRGWFDLLYTPISYDDSDRVNAVMAHSLDVTDKVVARQELEDLTERLSTSNAELEQFAYVTSHDLRAPLRGIAALTTWIEEDIGDGLPAQSREHLELLRSRVSRLEGLIDGILEFSRAGRNRGDVEDVAVGPVVEGILDLLAPPPGVVTIEGALPTVRATRVELQQVLQNLIGNALKHSDRETPDIRVFADTEPEGHRISIRDDGPGIEPAFHERIFGIFQTLRPRDEVESTGVGLSLVKKIVEARGGRVGLDSEPGVGSTFWFVWPKEPR